MVFNFFRLLEVVISVASTKHFTQIYAKCFINRLVQLSCHPTANFAVQKLIRYAQEKSEVCNFFQLYYNLFEYSHLLLNISV